MSRDWQKDMEMFEEGIKQARDLGFSPTIESSPYQVAIYWLQQAAKWKAKASEAEVKAHQEKERADKAEAYPTIDAYEATCTALHKHRERADKAEEREQKLREAIEEIAAYPPFEETNNGDRFYEQMREMAQVILISLYPDKEEEV